jgi:tRNA-2-methylthio-N6-dimethylallyladenosine synthase
MHQRVLEIELLGQNVNSWADPEAGLDFADLLRLVGATKGLRRLRFTTSHPRHLSDRIIEAMAQTATVCPELHLPMQSGSDRVLKAMYRGYTRERFVDRIQKLRRLIPGVALSTDVIVGFPGESEAEFRDTLQVLEEVGFDQVYAFVYSPRPHTRALALEDTTDPSVKAERLQRLLREQRERQQRLNQRFVGRTVEVLCEGPSKSRPDRYTGRSPCRRVVNFTAQEDVVGRLVQVEIQHAGPYSLAGRWLAPVAA